MLREWQSQKSNLGLLHEKYLLQSSELVLYPPYHLALFIYLFSYFIFIYFVGLGVWATSSGLHGLLWLDSIQEQSLMVLGKPYVVPGIQNRLETMAPWKSSAFCTICQPLFSSHSKASVSLSTVPNWSILFPEQNVICYCHINNKFFLWILKYFIFSFVCVFYFLFWWFVWRIFGLTSAEGTTYVQGFE